MIRVFGTRDSLLSALIANWANERLGLGRPQPAPRNDARPRQS